MIHLVGEVPRLSLASFKKEQGAEEIKTKIIIANSAFSRLQSYLWCRRTKGKVYQAVVHSNLPFGCETWSVRLHSTHERRDCEPTMELRCRLRLSCIPAQLVQRRLRWFAHAMRHPDGELFRDLI